MKHYAIWITMPFLLFSISAGPETQAETFHQAIFIETTNTYEDELKSSIEEQQKKDEAKTDLKVNLDGVSVPEATSEFKQVWHFPPTAQDLTGSCWAFSSTSFFESEVYRLSGRQIKLSEMYAVYWEYVEKAREFVRTRGDSAFGRGSQPNAVMRVWNQYGVVPQQAYDGMKDTQAHYDHRAMFSEMQGYLESLKESQEWNEEVVLSTIKSILDHYMGQPPTSFLWQGKELSPEDFLDNVLKIHLDDYVSVISLSEKPYHKKVEYTVWDNWWHSTNHYNVPLAEFMEIIESAVRNGYSFCIAGDNSEPGFSSEKDVAVVASFDIPSDYIDETSRQFRFGNSTTSDDHAIHLVGYQDTDGDIWYLIKDSSTKAQNGPNKGYMFYHEDFVKLKMLNIMVHKDPLEELGLKVK